VQLTASRLIVIDSDPVRARETSSSGWRQTVGGRKEGGSARAARPFVYPNLHFLEG